MNDLGNGIKDNKKSSIKCSVATCNYNKKNYCVADKIEVAPMTSSCDCCEDTMCDTYTSSEGIR